MSKSRVARLATVMTAMPMVAVAAGLPQLDFGNRLTTYQVLWGAVIFLILYILASRTALPMVATVLETRAKRIAGDLDDPDAQRSSRRAPTPASRPRRMPRRRRLAPRRRAAINAALDVVAEASGRVAIRQRSTTGWKNN